MDVEYDIREITFNVLSEEQIEKLSVCEVNESNLFSKGIPNSGTCMDLRLGTSDRRMRCSTCRHSSEVCCGHTGHINLATPVVSWLFQDTVRKVLQCVCFFCSNCLVDLEDRSIVRRFAFKQGGKRLSAISSYCKNKKCPVCEGPQPEWRGKDGLLIKARWAPGTEFASKDEEEFAKKPVTAGMIRNILKYIPEEHAAFIGVKNPENMVLTKLIVPPIAMRPSSSLSDGSRVKGHDDLTMILREITKDNEKIKKELEKGNPIPAREHESLLINLITYMDKDGGVGSQQLSLGGTGVARVARRHNNARSGPSMSLGRRLAGKRGRFRGTITGKRCDYTSRSVITPEPTLDLWQLAVPRFVARKQTIEVPVTAFNVELLRECVRRGDCPEGGGAHSVITPENSKIHLGMAKDLDILAQELCPGYKVRRHLRDGDWVVFNRQPTLHKMGMMGHQIVVRDQSTFGLPVPCTPPYNADFDGDEMNMHTAQGLKSIAEIREIMAVPWQLISAKDSKPSMKPVQDTVIGAYLLTNKDCFIKRETFFDLVMTVKWSKKKIPEPAIMYRDEETGKWQHLYTGAQLVSYLTPPQIYFEKAVRDFEVPEGKTRIDAGMDDIEQRLVIIDDGDLMMGKLCKATIGGVANGFIQRIHYMHGAWAAAEWISDLQRSIANWFPSRGFSIGLEDCIPSREIEDGVSAVVQRSIEAIKKGSKAARDAGVSEERIENERMRVASSVMSQSARVILNAVSKDNNILQCIQSGAKGKSMNIAQILGVLGQQVHSGKRIHDLFDGKGRTLSCYTEDEMDDPLAHGLVTGSYRDGLDVQSYYFHCMTGREGLIDTACKTSETGYLQRRLVKILESVYSAEDGTVRDGEKKIVTTKYGGDGMDTEKVVAVSVPILKKTGHPLAVCERWCGGAGEEAETLAPIYEQVRGILNRHENNSGKLYLPFDADVEAPMPQSSVPPARWAELKPLIEAACEKIARIVGERMNIMHMELSIRTSFCTRKLGRVTPASVKQSLDNIVRRVEKGRIDAGTAVGTIAATSIGEPATQMTLNTFHSAGTGNVTVSRGVPRFKELIDLSKNCATPSMRIFLNPELSHDVRVANQVAQDIACKFLKDFVVETQVIEDSDPTTSIVDEDRRMVEVYTKLALPVAKADWSRWIGRIVLDREAMLRKNLTVLHVRSSLRETLGDKVRIITSESMDEEWVCRLRMSKTLNALKLEKARALAAEVRGDAERMATEEIVISVVDESRIAGMASIKTAFVSKVNGEYIIDTDGSTLETVLSSGDLVDYRRTFSNSVHETFKCLGIEAARNVIRHETQTVINDSGYISVCHLDLLAEKMTTAGIMLPVTRHGMKRGKQGVLVSASFERTVDTFLHAAIHSEKDSAQGVTESIVMGRLHKMGTGHVTLLQDKSKHKELALKKRQKKVPAPRFIGRRKGQRRDTRMTWNFVSDPIHKLHAVQTKRRVFTPPPECSGGVGFSAESDVPMTPPTPPSEEDETEEVQHDPFQTWEVKMLMPQTPLWRIRFFEPEVIRTR